MADVKDIGREMSLGKNEKGVEITGVFLGEWNGREWFWDLTDNNIMWRVPEIRECIAAPPGYRILAADYSQIEVKLMAFLSKDPGLLKALNAKDSSGENTDIHCYMATEVYGQKLDFTYDLMVKILNGKASEGWGKAHSRYKELKTLRSNIKTTTFGVPYGAGAQTISRQTGLTEEQAQQLIDDYFAKFPVLKKWIEDQGSQAINYGYTQTPWGRKRFYTVPLMDSKNRDVELKQIRRWAGNHPIQAANADMLKYALRGIYRRIRGGITNGKKLYDARIILVVHDEIVMMCHEKDVEAVKAIMQEAMMEAYDMIIGDAIPNKVDVAEGIAWEKL